MAVEDAGGTVLGKPIDIVVADHQNKADVGVAIARRWFESEGVDLAIGFDHSAVALGVEQLAAQYNRIAIAAPSAAPPSRARIARPTKPPGFTTATR